MATQRGSSKKTAAARGAKAGTAVGSSRRPAVRSGGKAATTRTGKVKKRAIPDVSTADETLRWPEEASYTISSLDQIRVLADPLRIRLLECFGCERTTKQIANLLGEKPTKLYHHVDALERVGLIRLSRTKPNRGTLEKYYMAVARAFTADPKMFSEAGGDNEEGEALSSIVAALFERVNHELQELIRQGEGKSIIEEEGILVQMEVHGDDKELKAIRRRLERLVKDLQAKCCGESAPPSKVTDHGSRLVVAYYPIPKKKAAPKQAAPKKTASS